MIAKYVGSNLLEIEALLRGIGSKAPAVQIQSETAPNGNVRWTIIVEQQGSMSYRIKESNLSLEAVMLQVRDALRHVDLCRNGWRRGT